MDNKKDTEYKTGGDAVPGQTDYFSFLLAKSEKLSSAIYLVTSLVSDMEPMKWVMRERGLSLLSDISEAEHATLSDRMVLFETAEETAREMSALIGIARAGQIVSPMNADILIAAFNSLRDAIGRGVGVPTSAESIVSELLRGEDRPLLNQSDTSKGQKDTANVLYNRVKQHPALTYKRVDGTPKGHFHSAENGDKSSGETRQDRKKVIIDFIKKQKEVTIKDVFQVISGCSEKTIQRELITLVKDNVLKKVGERRWSKYSLK